MLVAFAIAALLPSRRRLWRLVRAVSHGALAADLARSASSRFARYAGRGRADRPRRAVRRAPALNDAAPIRQAVLRDGMEHVADEEYELDYLITPELGGSSDRRNLWPERYGSRVWNARVKDELERLLPQMVCEGRLDLATAQHDIASNWIAAYQKYFGTDRPLGSGAGRASPVLLAARFSPPRDR